MGIEAFPSERGIERFHMGLVRRLPRPRAVDLHLVLVGPEIDQLTAKLAASIAEESPWCTALRGEPIQYLDHMFATELLTHLNGHALSGAQVYHSQRPNPLPIRQLISDEVARPGVIGFCDRRPMGPGDDGFASPWRPMPERQALFAVEPIDEVLAHGPAFAIEQHPNLAITISYSCPSQLSHPLSEGRAGIAMTLIPLWGPRAADRPAGAAFADRIRRAQVRHDRSPLRGPYPFFASTSWSSTVSRDNSATNRLSLAFSSWSCLNSRTGSDSNPA